LILQRFNGEFSRISHSRGWQRQMTLRSSIWRRTGLSSTSSQKEWVRFTG